MHSLCRATAVHKWSDKGIVYGCRYFKLHIPVAKRWHKWETDCWGYKVLGGVSAPLIRNRSLISRLPLCPLDSPPCADIPGTSFRSWFLACCHCEIHRGLLPCQRNLVLCRKSSGMNMGAGTVFIYLQSPCCSLNIHCWRLEDVVGRPSGRTKRAALVFLNKPGVFYLLSLKAA